MEVMRSWSPLLSSPQKKNILDPGASPFVPAAREEQPLEDPPPEEVPIPLEEIALPAARDLGSDPPEDVQPTRAEDADFTDVAEPVRPVGGVATRSGRLIHPPDRLISDSVWSQVQTVLCSWLGD